MPAKKLGKKALYESFVGQKYAYRGGTYAVGRVLDADFAVVNVSPGYAPHFERTPCAGFVKSAVLVAAEAPAPCDGMLHKITSGYLTYFDGSDLCPACLITAASETCGECGELDDHESAAFVGDHILCRDCYNGKDEDELAQLREE